jgi:hypothetical protein
LFSEDFDVKNAGVADLHVEMDDLTPTVYTIREGRRRFKIIDNPAHGLGESTKSEAMV